ncbi:MAG: agmatinase [Eubacteriales bacterium]|nr:agmatinase [Clostridia bacterium]MDZ4043568.1 agmatinase [Eubacteriales bacterium]
MLKWTTKQCDFMAAGSDYQRSSMVIVGAPLDSTTSFRGGTRLGPRAIREMSYNLEDYSIELGSEISNVTFFDAGDLEFPLGYLEESLNRIEQVADRIVGDGKIPVFLGGEHLITLPIVKAVAKHYPELVVIHLDAHADLREEYLGAKLSHATVMRRVSEIVSPSNLFQFGVRSATREEIIFARDNGYMSIDDVLGGLEEVTPILKGRPVYLTLDIDVVDPAFAPGVGTPEPGGIDSRELLQSVYYLYDLNVVGLDIVEVNPTYDVSGRTAALAAKVLREAIICCGAGRRGKIKIVENNKHHNS